MTKKQLLFITTEAPIIEERPICDYCHAQEALYDTKTNKGPWAYLCEDCFRLIGIGLGLGRGQELIVINRKEEE